MSRAFVKEADDVPDLPDRPVSEHPNLVTPRGLDLIEQALAAAQRGYAEAQAAGDRAALARTGRELRYWSARRSSAQLVPQGACEAVGFGCSVTVLRSDGRRQTVRIVGEDEADPAHGSISHVAPLAQALLGGRIGDVVEIAGGEAEVIDIA